MIHKLSYFNPTGAMKKGNKSQSKNKNEFVVTYE